MNPNKFSYNYRAGTFSKNVIAKSICQKKRYARCDVNIKPNDLTIWPGVAPGFTG